MWTLLLGALVLPTPLKAQPEIDYAKAARVKAAYLQHIAQLTTWPAAAFEAAASPIVVGIVGDDPHGISEILRGAIEGRGLTAQQRPLEVRRIRLPVAEDGESSAAEREEADRALRSCHILFLLNSVHRQWPRVRAQICQHPVVSVSEFAGFSRSSGMIEFVTDPERSRVNLHIDLDAVRGAQLMLSSKLLGLKQVVSIVKSEPATHSCSAENSWKPDGPARLLSAEKHPDSNARGAHVQ